MTMQQWEYKVEDIYSVCDAEIWLNKAGREGWELVGIYTDKLDGYEKRTYAVFKRPKEN